MKALVTGGSGFLGRSIADGLVARGYEVHAVSRAPVDRVGVRAHAVDLLTVGAAETLLDSLRPSLLVHAAWITTGRYGPSLENLRWVERSSSLLAEFASKGGRRFVGVGTCFEYEWRMGDLSEDNPRRPVSLYGVAKSAFGELVLGLGAVSDLSTAWVRPFLLFGPHEHPDRLASSIMRSVLAGVPAKMSHGQQIRDFGYVGDIGDAIAAVSDSSGLGAWNVATGEPRTVLELASALADEAGDPSLLDVGAIEARPDEPERIVADVSRLREELDWTPPSGFEAGIRETARYWRARRGVAT